ncbi:hypothetical protein JRO89_XS01G0400600 [Xanthoceras sorbifolium]|uniref:Xyloglucan endotransglucosylase/hydrolase n=1 Tax=Xanthoceras sorbifolium TaxID=99658 RepID=A0ABQ8IQ24_9ROSI|nr:hypothetical protein JRO89_XS01G0400600 [Xanthoceras sorbifolium]
MESWVVFGLFAFVLVSSVNAIVRVDNTSFYENYRLTWGIDHALLVKQDKEIQLSIDKYSGAGFESKALYGSRFFHIKIKVPDKNSSGVITTFYLRSPSTHHDEIDFEFLGNNGPPYTLNTNLYTNGKGEREQQFRLWFNPTKHFHSYKLLWNQYQIVFLVDEVPIRVFKNNTEKGVSYPSKPMNIMASVWESQWAGKIDWRQAPFQAHYQGFHVDGCILNDLHIPKCYSSKYWWNHMENWKLNPTQQRSYKIVRNKYLTYDYCSDRSRYPKRPPECQINQ